MRGIRSTGADGAGQIGRRVTAIAFGAGLFLVALSVVSLLSNWWTVSASSTKAESRDLAHPDKACAECHREIYDRYERTSMAMGSGPAREGSLEGQFRHAASGVTYRVFEKDDALWMSYERPASSRPDAASTELHGRRQLLYFIGSGRRGRTYLYEVDGQWFELPINFYGKRGIWDMAPNFGSATSMPAPLPVDSNCLHCHATGVQTALPAAKNRYAGAPFEQGGIGCSGCHGDASRHLAEGGHGPIVNPDKLQPAQRDDVCLQCHLEGDAVVYRPDRSLAQFHPGDRLDQDALYFVKSSAERGGRRATSQYEALLRSACKAGSGDRLTCTTCHDPHETPAPEQRVAFFRARCLSCHTSETIALKHHPEQKDCAVCHMPTRATSDISHEQVTDHDIQRVPMSSASLEPGGLRIENELKPVGAASVGDRELGLAYAQMAVRGDRAAGSKALALLTKAEKAGASDAALHTQLGYLHQISGDRVAAAREYEQVLKQDAFEPSALGNLAVLRASAGRAGEAVAMLGRLLDADPAQTAAGMNLAFIECKLGDPGKARDVLQRLLPLNPDNRELRQFLGEGLYAGQRCELNLDGARNARH